MIMKAYFFSKRFPNKKKHQKKKFFRRERESKKRAGKNLVFFGEKETEVKEMILPRSSKKKNVSRLVLRLLV